jgi:hypothetical protein
MSYLDLAKNNLMLVYQQGDGDGDIESLINAQVTANKLLDKFLLGKISFCDYLDNLRYLGVDVDDYCKTIEVNLGLNLL